MTAAHGTAKGGTITGGRAVKKKRAYARRALQRTPEIYAAGLTIDTIFPEICDAAPPCEAIDVRARWRAESACGDRSMCAGELYAETPRRRRAEMSAEIAPNLLELAQFADRTRCRSMTRTDRAVLVGVESLCSPQPETIGRRVTRGTSSRGVRVYGP